MMVLVENLSRVLLLIQAYAKEFGLNRGFTWAIDAAKVAWADANEL